MILSHILLSALRPAWTVISPAVLRCIRAGATLLVCQAEDKDSSDSELRSEASSSELVPDSPVHLGLATSHYTQDPPQTQWCLFAFCQSTQSGRSFSPCILGHPEGDLPKKC